MRTLHRATRKHEHAAGKYAWLRDRVDKVVNEFATAFHADGRFPEWQRLVDRFAKTANVASPPDFEKLAAVEAAQNELCIAYALLQRSDPRVDRVEYEPPLDGCEQSIDFRATGNGLTLYVDVKTIQPQFKDRWDQFKKANTEKWFPENTVVDPIF